MKRRHDDRNHQKAMKLSIASKHSSAPVGERNLGIRRVSHRRSAGKYFPLSFRRKKSMPPQDTRPTKSLPPRATKKRRVNPTLHTCSAWRHAGLPFTLGISGDTSALFVPQSTIGS